MTETAKLGVWAITLNAYRLVFGDFGWFLRTAWAWVAVYVVFIAAVIFLPALAGEPGRLVLYLFPWRVLLAIPIASIAVLWHRRMLLGELPLAPYYLKLARVERRYLLFAAGIAVAYVLLPILMDYATRLPRSLDLGIPGYLLVVGLLFLFVGYLATPLLVMLPAAAAGNLVPNYAEARQLIRNNALFLWFAMLLVVVPFNMAEKMVSSIPLSALMPARPESWLVVFAIERVLAGFFLFATTATAAVVLSLAYQKLVPASDESMPPEPPPN